MKFLQLEQIDSQVCRNLNLVREGGFQKSHKFYDHDLRIGERENLNKATLKQLSIRMIRKFYLG